MALERGTKLGSYHVTAKIGEGGVGEVYCVPTGSKGWQDA